MSIEDTDYVPGILNLADVERMIAMLSREIESSDSLQVKRQRVFEGIAKLVEADVWAWIQSRMEPGQIVPAPIGVLEGGYRDDAERNRFHLGNFDPDINKTLASFWDDDHLTLLQGQLFKPDNPTLLKWQQTTQLIDCVMSVFPVGNYTYSCIGLHRRRGSPPFEPRHRAIVHAMFGQLGFLHRPGADAPGNNHKLYELTPRAQQVLMYLLAGDQAKQIATKTQLSIHTVNDYIKIIYKHFNVITRPELMLMFNNGIQSSSIRKPRPEN